MNKQTFLDKLKKSLSILNADEREDILNEYKDIIEEKVKHGYTEEEAVKDFGDYKELVSGILDAYKINPEEAKDGNVKDKAKDFLSSGEELIKEGAKKLTEATDKLVSDIKDSNTEMTLENIFEIIIKVLCFLVIMALLTIPFKIFSNIGSGFLNIGFFPVSQIFKVLWNILMGILYLVSCAFLLITLFKSNINKDPSISKKDTKKKREGEEVGEPEKENRQEEKKEKVMQKQTKDTLGNLLIILLKVFMIIVFLIPLWGTIIGLSVLVAITVFFLLKGIGVFGILLGLIGGIGFLAFLSNLLYNGLFYQKKIHVYPFIISIVFMILGGVLTLDFITDIHYIDEFPNKEIAMKEKTFDYSIEKETTLDVNGEDVTYETDPSLETGKLFIRVKYYQKYRVPDMKLYHVNEHNYISLKNENASFNTKERFDIFINDLKQKKIYNYMRMNDVEITVVTNEETRNLIQID